MGRSVGWLVVGQSEVGQSVGWSVGWLVSWLVGWSVGWSTRPLVDRLFCLFSVYQQLVYPALFLKSKPVTWPMKGRLRVGGGCNSGGLGQYVAGQGFNVAAQGQCCSEITVSVHLMSFKISR